MGILEDINEQWSKDSKLDPLNLAEESARVPQLSAKYLNYYSQVKKQLIAFYKARALMRRDKYLYYSGKADPSAYADRPFQLKVLRGDLDVFVLSDEDVVDLDAKIQMAELCLEVIKGVLSQIKDRTWQVRNSIEFQRLMNGG